MLTSETKRHIDAARQVLVGVVPNPAEQINQITNALIYKFMDDMDQSAIKAGGNPSFFIDKLEEYSWTRLMDTRIGNQQRMNLYSEALIKFSESQQLPPLFRDIFKSAFLPYRSPEVLGLFLKEISYFDYSHSEELGNAYEYLLSIMSSQGDAGQFRTPRHIIDFIVAAVNPTKDDKVLDPACGTAGFLISAYKHILAQHDGKNSDGSKNSEKPLTPDQRRALLSNFEGYDIDPSMVRIAQVNMYLHQFKNPKIFSYNTLADEERWNDKFDVILANPPFMSPKGSVGIHNKFSIQSSRSEVLFVDYIISHLRPKGRAGLIVPEGIIFQSSTGHTQLRKNLIEDGLYAVISLPSGIFQPYSGVKTSILLFDNDLTKKRKEILFIDIKDVGISLGTAKKEIEKNDLIPAIQIIRSFQSNEVIESTKLAFVVNKSEFVQHGYDLSLNKYKTTISKSLERPFVQLSKVCNILKGKSSSTKTEPGNYQLLLTAEESKTADHYDFDGTGVCVPLISATGHGKAAIKRIHFAKGKFALANLLAFVEPKSVNELDSKYLFYCLEYAKDEMAKMMKGAANVSMKIDDLENFQIPLPSLEVQQQIVEELDGYQKIISGARQVVENWKPRIEVEEGWERVKLGDIAEYFIGLTYSPEDVSDKGIIILRSSNVQNGELDFSDIVRVSKKVKENLIVQDGDILMCSRNGSKRLVGKIAVIKNLREKMSFGTFMTIIRSKYNQFLSYFFVLDLFRDQIEGSETSSINQITKYMLDKIVVPLPPVEIQKEIVEKIEAERVLVDGNRKLMEIYEQKNKDILAKLWHK